LLIFTITTSTINIDVIYIVDDIDNMKDLIGIDDIDYINDDINNTDHINNTHNRLLGIG
jgi:hypothetical protein